MNFDELQKDRNSPRNNLPKEQHLVLVEKFARQMVGRRRFQTFWLIHTFIWLTLITGLAIWLVVVGKANFAHEWGFVPAVARAVGVCHPLPSAASEAGRAGKRGIAI